MGCGRYGARIKRGVHLSSSYSQKLISYATLSQIREGKFRLVAGIQKLWILYTFDFIIIIIFDYLDALAYF